MPKKRFLPLYSKPQSTVHPSLDSQPLPEGSSSAQNASPSVNDLIASSRQSTTSSLSSAPPPPTATLPPQIRHLLAQAETQAPPPRIRSRRAIDANGRRIPPGPPPPRSWLEHAPASTNKRLRKQKRMCPVDLYHLPGLKESNGKRLQDMCMRQMARHWEFIREYEQNNLADLPTQLRVELLSHIAVNGPDDGVGFVGLRNLITPRHLLAFSKLNDIHQGAQKEEHITPEISQPLLNEAISHPPNENWEFEDSDTDFNLQEHNDKFSRLDLSGSIGRSVSIKQLTSLVERPSMSFAASIPHLTHLSLSHPASGVSWRNLLTLCTHLPILTHLSLAYWPTPSLTVNTKTAMMSSGYGKDFQYGGTNYYSHSLDNDFREAADVLRRLAGRLYGLEYLDLSGCLEWIPALRWTEPINPAKVLQTGTEMEAVGNNPQTGLDWGHQWPKLSGLKLNNLVTLNEASELSEVNHFVKGVREARATAYVLACWSTKGDRKGAWVDVSYDDHRPYDAFWQDRGDYEILKRRSVLNNLDYLSGGTLGLHEWTELVVLPQMRGPSAG